MKYIKTYENITPQINDYVIIDDYNYNQIMKNFLQNNIGKIVLTKEKSLTDAYYVEFDKPNPWDYSKYLSIQPNQIKYYSTNKEDCEIYLTKLKYNL